jgi:hypothetical protein
MEPRIVLIADILNKTDVQVWEVLKSIGVWVFGHNQNAIWQVREQLHVAHAVVIVIDRRSPSGNYDTVNEIFEGQLGEVLSYHKENPGLPIMTVFEESGNLPRDLKMFRTLQFKETLKPNELREIVEFVFNAARPAVDDKKPDVDMLRAKGTIELNRLKIIAEESEVAIIWPIVAVTITIAGLALSIPGVLSRLALSDYWLFLGPVIFIAGALTTIYVVRRHAHGHRLKTIATRLIEELSSVLNQLEPKRKSKEPQSETQNSAIPT